MKSVKSNSCCEPVRPFPKLMIGHNTSQIVLFSEEGKGVVVYQNRSSGHKVGYYHEKWGKLFNDYKGDVCLTND